jgi:hypothetical protein
LLRWQFVGKNCDKNQIVYSEDPFQHDQCQQSKPRSGVRNPFYK